MKSDYKNLTFKELYNQIFKDGIVTKQNKDRLFKLAKANEDIKTIEKMANELDFKSAKAFLSKQKNLSLEDTIKNSDALSFKKLVDEGADISKIKVSDLIDKRHDDEIIKIFIKKGYYVNVAQLVKKKFDIKTIKLALDNGAKVDDVDNSGLTGILYACEYKNNNILKLLLSNGANPNKSNSSRTSPLLISIDKGCYENVKILLEYHADVNFQSSIDGVTPLIAALDDKNLEIAKLLLTEGTNIDVNLQDINNSTALTKAAYENYIDIVKLLLTKKDIKLNLQGYMGGTALLNAVQNQNSEIAYLLLDAGADASISNEFNTNALNYALENLDYEMSNLLIKKGIIPIVKKLDQKQIDIQNNSQMLTQKFIEKLKELIKNKEVALNLIKEIILCKKIKTDFLNEYRLDIDLKKIDKNNLNKEIIEFIETLLTEELIMLEKINKKRIPEIMLMGYKIDFFKKHINIIMQQFLLGIYSNDQYSNIKHDEYENEYLYRLILRDQIDGKVIVDIYENSLIHNFETNIGKRFRVEYKRINENLYYDKKCGYIMIINDYFVEKPLKGGVAIHKFNLVDEFNNIISTSNKLIHNPKLLSNKLKKFSEPKLKYTNHDWDQSNLTYEKFISDARDGWNEIKNDILILTKDENNNSKLYLNIESFLFNKHLGNVTPSGELVCWGKGDDKFTEGWSSDKIIKIGNKPHTDKTFKIIMDYFKSLFVIKQDSKDLKLLKKFTKLRKENIYDFKLDLEQIKTVDHENIFTDVERLEFALSTILSEINDRVDRGNEVKVIIEPDKKTNTVVLKIIHIGSTSKSDVDDLVNAINKSGFKGIYENLRSVCDWSIETFCSDEKRYKIDYLYQEIDNNKPHSYPIENEIEGFTHILRFYV